MKKKILFKINSEYSRFYIKLALKLQKKYDCNLSFLVNNITVKKIVESISPKSSPLIISDLNKKKIDISILHKKSKRIEEFYNTKLSLIISQDRSFGQGYLYNVSKVPEIKRSNWEYDEILSYYVDLIEKYEKNISDKDIYIEHILSPVAHMVCKKFNVKCFGLASAKYEDRMIWVTSPHLINLKYIERIKNNLNKKNSITKNIKYKIDEEASRRIKKQEVTFLSIFKRSIEIIYSETKSLILRTKRKNTYSYYAWLIPNIRKFTNHLYLKKIGIGLNSLNSKKFVFFPMHLEPEIALLNVSPEFSNSMECITWISKSLPFNYYLVLKEHPASLSVRDQNYYRMLNKIPNVFFSDPSISSWELIKKSTFASTITGTVGFESIFFNKPVISFGKNQIINNLPSVFYSSNYEQTNLNIDKILKIIDDKELLQFSKTILYNSLIESSFDLPELKFIGQNQDVSDNTVDIAFSNLINEHSDAF